MLSSQVMFLADRQMDRQTDGQRDRQTPVKQYAPDLSMRGHKNIEHCYTRICLVIDAST